MKIAISQSNYIPWKGYFDMIDSVDIFVLFDSVQYTKRDWRNRNLIKTAQGEKWLSIPIENKSFTQRIDETTINQEEKLWYVKHLKSLKVNYAKSRYFKEIYPWVEHIYNHKIASLNKLSDINEVLIREICSYLNINTKIVRDTDFELSGQKNQKLINICKQLNGSAYLSGPAAKSYIDEELFQLSNLSVEWMSYSGYKEYDQLYGSFIHGVSILDILFNLGSDSYKYIKKGINA